jgi:DNA-binding NtrC family response regulator
MGASASIHRKGRLLVVEGDVEQRELLTSLLCAAGHDVVGAGGVVAALDAMRAQRFDVVVTESALPDGFASELITRLPIRHERIVVMTADDDLNLPDSVTVLIKPLDPARLRFEVARRVVPR